jgi:hypothetical protein
VEPKGAFLVNVVVREPTAKRKKLPPAVSRLALLVRVSRVRYQWDGVSKFGQTYKGGFARQLLFIDCKRDVVIAYLGTNTDENWHLEPLPLVRLIETYF